MNSQLNVNREPTPVQEKSSAPSRVIRGSMDAELRAAVGKVHLRAYGIAVPGEKQDPLMGQCPKQFRFDRSLGMLHGVAAFGVGLGAAGVLVGGLTADTILAGSEVFGGATEAVAGAGGVFSWIKTQFYLSRKSFPNDAGSANLSAMSPGYSTGLGNVSMPAVLCACLGWQLYNSHMLSCLGTFVVSSIVLAGYHALRYRNFIRTERRVQSK